MLQKTLPIVVVLIVLGIGTYLQGVYCERWTPLNSEILDTFTARLENVPEEIGNWISQDLDYDEDQFKKSNCRGCISRIYTNRRTGEKVNVYLVSGTARHATIHTPDWCYRGAGYKMDGKPAPYSIDCGTEIPTPEFSTTTFYKDTHHVERENLRILWSFSDDGQWKGPKLAKTFFAGRPALFKLYLITPTVDQRQEIEDNPSMSFAKEFMPVLNGVLFPIQEPLNETEATS